MENRPLGVENLDLGEMPNERFVLRLWLLLRSVPRLFLARRFLSGADVVIARNFDLLALAWIARRSGTPLVYECLDIHSLMTGSGRVNRVMRAAERFLMRRCQLLWTSSPGFLRHYFETVQGYDGPSVILENKLWFGSDEPVRPGLESRPSGDGPLVLGWVGTIRCQASFDILCHAARAMPDDLKIEIHGIVHHHAIADFDARVAELPNVTYHGPYSYPEGLAGVYGGCDMVWAQDLWQRGGNSDWLLPNRVYEASWYGCPSVAVADTETGRRVAEQGLGPVIATDSAEALTECLRGIGRSQTREMSKDILHLDDALFRLSDADIEDALAPVLGASGR